MTTRIEQLPILSHTGVNSPNSVSYQVPVASRTISGVEWQVCGFWARNSTTNASYASDRLVLGKRILPWGEWSWYICNGVGGLADITITGDDSHDTVAVEIDADGFVHVWYDHHNTTPINYRRSTAALATWTGALTALQTMPVGSAVTYPHPFRSPDGVLYYIGRQVGSSANGDWYFFRYTEATTSWAGAAGTGTDGLFINGIADTRGPYPFLGPSFSPDWDGAGTGFLHFMWTLRRTTDLTNNDVFHMRWNGTSWTQYDGTSQTMPATIGTARQVLEVAESELMHNSSGMCVDGNGRPHAALIKSDGTQHQLYDLYYNGSTWSLQQITAYSSANTWSDYGRTCCAADQDTNEVFFWGTHNTLETGIQQWKSGAGDFTTWAKTTFFNADVGDHEPNIDRQQWLSNHVVCMWVHRGKAQTDDLVTPRLVTRLPKGRSSAWVESNWSRKHPIVVDETKVGTGGVTNYTVVLTRANFASEVCDPSGANKAQKDGGDLRFFSDSGLTTALACQVVSFGYDSTTGAGDAFVEVRVGPITLSDSVDTTIYVAYAASSTKHQPFVDETGGAIAAHDGSWSVMAPLNVASGNSAIVDDTGFGWTKEDVATGAGQIGNEAEFTGDSGYVLASRVMGIGSAFSVAAVVDVGASTATSPTFLSADANNSHRGMLFRAESTGVVGLIRFNSSSAVTTNITGTTDLRSAGKKRVVAEWSSTDGARILVNGAQEASDANLTAQHDDALLNWAVACRHRTSTPYGDSFLTGAIDQLEMHTARRGSAWWTTDYNNVMSPATFAAAGAASDISGEPELAPAGVEHGHTLEAVTLSAAVTLSIASMSHAHTIDATTLSADMTLAVADALHGMEIENAELDTSSALTVAGVEHAHQMEAPTLTADMTLDAAGMEHQHAVESPSLSADMGLAVADLTHAHTLDAVDLELAGALVVADTAHAHEIGAVVLSADMSLAVADTTHSHTAENVDLIFGDSLDIAGTTHASEIEAVTLQAAMSLVIDEATHGHQIDAITLSAALDLIVAGSTHAHTLEAVELLTGISLAVQDATHAHLIDGVTLEAALSLAIADALHGHALDAVALQTAITLLVNDALHAHTIDSVGVFIPAVGSSAMRTLLVAVENRVLAIQAENRTRTI